MGKRAWALQRAHASPPGVSQNAKTAMKRRVRRREWKVRMMGGLKRSGKKRREYSDDMMILMFLLALLICYVNQRFQRENEALEECGIYYIYC